MVYFCFIKQKYQVLTFIIGIFAVEVFLVFWQKESSGCSSVDVGSTFHEEFNQLHIAVDDSDVQTTLACI